MNSDGSNPHNVTNNPGTDSHPTWSPDGSKIAFQSERDGNWEIYVMNSDGSEQVRLTNDRGVDQSPTWSPDGTKIAFVSDRGGRHSVWTVNSDDGSEPVDVTGSYVNSRWPAWGPRSRTLAYETVQDVRMSCGLTMSNSTRRSSIRTTSSTASSWDGLTGRPTARSWR